MTDDSLEIQKDEVPFHPCLTPRGMTWYDLNVLTPLQQKLLNELKVDVIRENNQYLARHPEIRAIVALFLRAILTEQPKLKTIADFAKDFFSRPKVTLQCEIDQYLKERGEPLKKEGDSAVNLQVVPSTAVSSREDLSSLYRQGYYTYLSYTDERSSVEAAEEWVSGEDIEHLYKHPPSSYGGVTYTSSDMSDADYERKQFELLFASRVSLFSGEAESSIEESTISMTKDYIESYADVSQDKELTDRESGLEDEESKQALEEMEMAEEIQGKLSVILEKIDEEEDREGYYEYEELLSKKSLNEMDLEDMKENVFDEETGPQPSENPSDILETNVEYEYEGEG